MTRLHGIACAAMIIGLSTPRGGAAQVVVIGPEPVTVDPSTLPDRHQVGPDETLSLLAEKYLGNGDAWPKLWSFNPEVTNPHWIYPGLILRLKPGVPLSGPTDVPPAEAGAAAAAKTTATGTGLTIAGRRRHPSGTGSVLIGEQVYLDGDALSHAGKVAGAPEDHFMLSPTDEVYVKFKKDVRPRAGQELTLFTRLSKGTVAPPAAVFPPDSPPALDKNADGEVVRVVGALRVLSYDPARRVAKATITEALEPIERGFEVTDVPHRITTTPPKPNARELDAHIIASSRGLGQLGKEDLVFIDAGSKRGVEVGNRLFVIRQGDPWRSQLRSRESRFGALMPDEDPPSSEELPPEVVGEVHVLYVRPDSATAVVSRASMELSPGDRVHMKAGY